MNKSPGTTIKIMMTGGHITPALATIEELQKKHPEWEIVFVGRKTALEGYITHSEEYRLISDLGLTFLPISAGRVKREGGFRVFMGLTKIPVGIFQAAWYMGWHRPSLVISFGGYVAFPVVLAAWVWRVPIVTHEQTTRPGLANRVIAHLATKICVSFPDAASRLGTNARVEVTGLPIRSDVLIVPKKSPMALDSKLPLLFIVGGSTGSTSINEIVFRALPELLEQFTVVHQVGRVSQDRASQVHSALSPSLGSRYHPVPYVSTETYSYLMHKAALIVGRSGANTVTEIAIVGKVALFIPLPWSAGQEQYHNAKVLENAGSCQIVEQKKLTEESLVRHIRAMMKGMPEYTRKAKAFASTIPHDGATRLTAVIAETLGV